MDRRQPWIVLSGLAAELTVLAWAVFAFDLPLEALLLVGGALALSLSMVRLVRPSWYGLAVAWIFLAVASQWYFGRVVSPGYRAVHKALVATEDD